MIRNEALEADLIQATDCRSFLLHALRGGQNGLPRGSLAALARKSGLSRSFLTEIMQGKKRITASSSVRLLKALRLQGDLKKYFEILVELESLDGSGSKTDVEGRLFRLKQKITHKAQAKSIVAAGEAEFLSSHVFMVFASLGSMRSGASFEAIVQKTKLTDSQVKAVLQKMLEAQWIEFRGLRYYALNRVLDFEELGQHVGFLKALSESSFEIAKRAQEIAEDPNNLVFYSAFSVNEERLSDLKEKLRAAVLDVLDEFQDDEGSKIRKVTLSMY